VKNHKRIKVAIMLTSSYGVIVNVALLFAMFAPMYVLSGPINGFVSVVTYSIRAFGRNYYSPALDMASFLSVIVITSSTLNVAAGLATTYLVLRKGKPSLTALEALMASALTLLISLGTLSAIRRIVAYELSYLTKNYSYSSSAGNVIIEGVHLTPLPASIIFRGMTYALITVPYVIAATAVCTYFMRSTQKGNA